MPLRSFSFLPCVFLFVASALALPIVEVPPAPTAQTPEHRAALETCIKAVASQSDPVKLATLGSRQANPRLKKVMYYLATARAGGTVE